MARNLSNNTCSILKVEIHCQISVQYNIFFLLNKVGYSSITTKKHSFMKDNET